METQDVLTCPRVTIHIGHGKTGSSAIQTYLARVADCLPSHGVSYPYHRSLQWAKKGEISSGNGRLLLEEGYIRPTAHDLFSDETLFARLDEARLRRFASAYPGGVHVVCYTRDFFDHAVSAWGQSIKRSGFKKGLPAFFKNSYGGHLKNLLNWLEMKDRVGFSLSVFNYSRHKTELIPHFMTAALGDVGMSISKDIPVTHTSVNRSLTLAEYELQRLMNVHFPKKTSTFVSDALVNELPNIKSERPFISRELYDSVRSKFIKDVNSVNLKLEPAEQIIFEPYEALRANNPKNVKNAFRLHQRQLEVYIRSMSRALVQPDIGRLERMLASHEDGEPICRSDAVYLASILKAMRPNSEQYEKAYNRLTDAVAPTGSTSLSSLLRRAIRRLNKR